MPREDLGTDESFQVLANEHLVRIAFMDGPCSYLIPLGYAWRKGALFGVAERGRKTRLAEANPLVAFQVDTSIKTGLWEWESVTGTGRFKLAEGKEKSLALESLQQVIAEAPDWWRREQMPRMSSGALIVWKLTPENLTGCRYRPPRDVQR